MIKLLDFENDREIIVYPTIFPDGTSQVWKLPIKEMEGSFTKIIWLYEYEVELIWLNQLVDLTRKYTKLVHISIPYLPFARQDKSILPECTFAKSTFLRMLPNDVPIYSWDVHSQDSEDRILSIDPSRVMRNILREHNYYRVIYPDAGAQQRYSEIINHPYLSLEKKRNQSTGEIEGLEFREEDAAYLHNSKVLIVDDLADYGGTFCLTANKIKEQAPTCDIHLYVTHGLFHGGLDKMKASGISKFYTSKSLSVYRKSRGINIDKQLNIKSYNED